MARSLGTFVAVAVVFASAVRAVEMLEMLEMPGRRSLMSGPRFDTVRRARARVDERDRKNQPEEKTRNAHGGKAWIIATNPLIANPFSFVITMDVWNVIHANATRC